MNYLFSAESKKRRSRLRSITTVIIIVVLAAAVFAGSKRFLPPILTEIGTPLWKGQQTMLQSITRFAEGLKTKGSIGFELDRLREENKRLRLENTSAQRLEEENKELREIMGRREDERRMLAAVLARPRVAAYDILIIDLGSEAGVRRGDEVLAVGNVAIGTVEEVYKRASRVALYSKAGRVTLVRIEGLGSLEVEALGAGGGNFEVHVPRGVDVREGDSVLLPAGRTRTFGVVERIEFKESDAFARVLFKSSINSNELRWVEVVINEGENLHTGESDS